mmetsp:Transcript_29872/g.53747  ORF Transcript_29872/g.53747 Transcript_29872/m.53747 type:complete len:218 (-) Transcript_29872:1512-2165(-)
MSFFRRLFGGGKKDTVQKPPPRYPEPSRPSNPPKSAEAQRIRWVNEDATSQPTLPGQPEPSRAPAPHSSVSGAGAAQGQVRVPNGVIGEVNQPRSEPQSACSAYQAGASGSVSGLNKPRSAPVVRNTQVQPSAGFRPQSAVTKMPGKRFVQPSSEFSFHGTRKQDESDGPLASSSFPFKQRGTAGPIDPLARDGKASFSQTQHTRVNLDPFTDDGGK